MNPVDIILTVILAAAAFFALRRIVRSRRSGSCPGCGECGRSSCPYRK